MQRRTKMLKYIARYLFAAFLITLLLLPSVARAYQPSDDSGDMQLKEVNDENDSFLQGCSYYHNKAKWEQDKDSDQYKDQKAWAVIYKGSCKEVVWVPSDQEPTDNEKINHWINVSSQDKASDLWYDISVPQARIGVNPWLGLVNVPSWFWIDWKNGYNPNATDGSQYLTNSGSTWFKDVDVRVKPVSYVWSFGDSNQTYFTDKPGKPYPQQSPIRHVYTQSTYDDSDGYQQSVIIKWQAEYRTDDGDYQYLGMSFQPLDNHQRVQQSQSVLTDPDLSSQLPDQPSSWWNKQPYSEPTTFQHLQGFRYEAQNLLATFGHTALDLIGIVDPFGIADGINALWYLAEGDYANAAISAAGLIPYVGDIAKVGKYGVKGVRMAAKLEKAEEGVKTARNVEKGGKELKNGKPPVEGTAKNPVVKCAASFNPNTPVSTSNGLVPISSIQPGQKVLAYNLNTHSTGYYPVSRVIVHQDPRITELVISGEKIGTTPEHPFWTKDGWKDASKLSVGTRIRNADGDWGTVQNIYSYAHPQRMYDLTVPDAHTFFVGNNQWLVHNDSCVNPNNYPTKRTPSSKPADQYEIKHTGSNNYEVSGGGEKIWADGIDKSNGYLQDAKYIGNPERSPWIPGSKIKPEIRSMINKKIEGEIKRYSAVINDSKTPFKGLEIITNDPRAVPYFKSLLRKYNVPGKVVVKK